MTTLRVERSEDAWQQRLALAALQLARTTHQVAHLEEVLETAQEKVEKRRDELMQEPDYPWNESGDVAFVAAEEKVAFDARNLEGAREHVNALVLGLRQDILHAARSLDDLDRVLDRIYHTPDVSLEARCALRALVVDVFSSMKVESLLPAERRHRVASAQEPLGQLAYDGLADSAVHAEGDEDAVFVPAPPTQDFMDGLPPATTHQFSDVFALPAYGDPAVALKLLSNPAQMRRLCALVEDSGFVGNCPVALLSVPLDTASVSRIGVLAAVSGLLESGAVLDREPSVFNPAFADSLAADTVSAQPLVKASSPGRHLGSTFQADASALLRKHVPAAPGHFLLVGVRLRDWAPTALPHQDALFRPDDVPLEVRTSRNLCWRTLMANIVSTVTGDPSELLVRPPTNVLRARAQANAWALVQQLYTRLGARPFARIDFNQHRQTDVDTGPMDWLALLAYDDQGRVLAKSEAVSLFESGASDGFSDVLREECGPDGPRTWLSSAALLSPDAIEGLGRASRT